MLMGINRIVVIEERIDSSRNTRDPAVLAALQRLPRPQGVG